MLAATYGLRNTIAPIKKTTEDSITPRDRIAQVIALLLLAVGWSFALDLVPHGWFPHLLMAQAAHAGALFAGVPMLWRGHPNERLFEQFWGAQQFVPASTQREVLDHLGGRGHILYREDIVLSDAEEWIGANSKRRTALCDQKMLALNIALARFGLPGLSYADKTTLTYALENAGQHVVTRGRWAWIVLAVDDSGERWVYLMDNGPGFDVHRTLEEEITDPETSRRGIGLQIMRGRGRRLENDIKAKGWRASGTRRTIAHASREWIVLSRGTQYEAAADRFIERSSPSKGTIFALHLNENGDHPKVALLLWDMLLALAARPFTNLTNNRQLRQAA
jgi:hypothetical protein